MAAHTTRLSRNALKVIRVTLLGGVLLFGALIWYLHSTEAPTPLSPEASNPLRLAFLIILVIDLPLLFAIRSMQPRASGFSSASRLAVLGWALAEGVAVLGGIIYLLTTEVSFYLFGVAALLASFVIVPIPADPDDAGGSAHAGRSR